MFHHLDETLQKILSAAPPPLGGTAGAAVSFVPPNHKFKPQVPTVNLFLHRIHEDRELRETAPRIVMRDDGTAVRKLPPLRVDCSYLVTAWASGNADDPTETQIRDEHKLLSLALGWLSRFEEIPEDLLAGDLATADYLPITMAARLDAQRVPVDFWTALRIAPRPAFDLTVTIAIDPGKTDTEGEQVINRSAKLFSGTGEHQPTEPGHIELIGIGGTVRRNAGVKEAIKGATVKLGDTGRVAKTDENGRYAFPNTPPGRYAVVVSAAGFATQLRTVRVPQPDASGTEYDFFL